MYRRKNNQTSFSIGKISFSLFVPVFTFVQNGKWEVYILGSDGKPVSRESWKVIYADSEETEKR